MRGGARNYPKGNGVRVNLSCRIDPDTMAKLKALSAELDMGIGALIDDLVRFYDDVDQAIERLY